MPRPLTSLWQLPARVERARRGVLGRMAPGSEPEAETAVVMLLAALGTPRDAVERAQHLLRAVGALTAFDEVQERLARSVERGEIAGVPTRAQLLFGGLDMLRFLFEPGAAQSDAARGITPSLHRLLRLAGDPVSWLDPGGVTASRGHVVRHLLSDYHFNPVYDLQLLSTFEGGLDQLEEEARQVLAGTHPEQAWLDDRIPDRSYYQGLADYVRARRSDPAARVPVIRDPGGGGNNLPNMDAAARASFEAAAGQLSELWGFLDYCHSLPTEPAALLARLRSTRTFLDARADVPQRRRSNSIR